MALLNDFGKKISKTGQGMVQKTKDTVDIVKLNNQIADDEKALQTLWIELGMQYYALHATDAEQSCRELVQSIAEIKARLQLYEEQKRALKGIVVCESCGAKVTYASAFCNECGNPIVKQSSGVLTDAGKRPCPFCAQAVDVNAAFCKYCGKKIAGVAAESKETEQACCTACGASLRDGMNFCSECGTPRA